VSIVRLRQRLRSNWVLQSQHTYLLNLLLHSAAITVYHPSAPSEDAILGRPGWKHVQLQSWMPWHLKRGVLADTTYSVRHCYDARMTGSHRRLHSAPYRDTWSAAVVCPYGVCTRSGLVVSKKFQSFWWRLIMYIWRWRRTAALWCRWCIKLVICCDDIVMNHICYKPHHQHHLPRCFPCRIKQWSWPTVLATWWQVTWPSSTSTSTLKRYSSTTRVQVQVPSTTSLVRWWYCEYRVDWSQWE